jgi:predicted dehydrogenase/nucleoside-diphosphate-sugar epimerase
MLLASAPPLKAAQVSFEMANPSSQPPLRVAVVGAGFIADFHLEVLNSTPGVELVAVCDAVLGRAQAKAKQFDIPHAVASIAELKELDVQMASLLLPPPLHATLIRETLEAGIGVMVEKPMVLSSKDARELGALADEKGLTLAVNHNAVTHPSFANLMQRINAGQIGRVEHVRVTLSVPLRQLDAGDFSHWMFRTPANIVFEQGPHPCAQVHALVGAVKSATTTVLKSRELHPGQKFNNRWLVAAEAERGTVEMYFAFGEDFTRSTVEVIGTDGSIEADLFHDHIAAECKTKYLDFWNSYLAGSRRGKQLKRSATKVLKDYLKFTIGIGPREDAFFAGMRDSIRGTYQAIADGRAPLATAEDGAQVLEWCEAITKNISNESGAAEVKLTEAPARPGEVVLLGGTGFIGKRVIEKLLAREIPVTLIVRRTHSMPAIVVDNAANGKIRLVHGTLENGASMRAALEGARAVVQLATGGGDSWEAVQTAMIGGSVGLAQAAIDAGAERYVYISSVASLYCGLDCGEREIPDSMSTDPLPLERPLYARGKAATEDALLSMHQDKGLPLVILRPGVVLGEGTPMQHSGLGLWARDNHCVGWGIGSTPLPLVWVDDVADAIVDSALFNGDDLHGLTMNLCARIDLNAQQVVEELRKATGRDLHFHARSLSMSQAMEIGKWIVKRIGGRKVAFPSYRDLKSRGLAVPFACDGARKHLEWKPVEEREDFLDKAIRIYGA